MSGWNRLTPSTLSWRRCNLHVAKLVQKRYFDRRTREAGRFAKDDWVWLLRRHILTLQPSNKLDFKQVVPFQVGEVLSPNTYRLILPEHMSRFHPVFHPLLLLPFPRPPLRSLPFGVLHARVPRGDPGFLLGGKQREFAHWIMEIGRAHV